MTIRFKLTMTAIAVILLANSLLLLVALKYVGHIWMQEVQAQVGLDLNSARAAYHGHIEVTDAFLRAMALGRTLAAAIEHDDRAELQSLLDRAHRTGGMDFLAVLDPAGKVLCRARNPQRARRRPLRAIRSSPACWQRKSPLSGTIILSAAGAGRRGAGAGGAGAFRTGRHPRGTPHRRHRPQRRHGHSPRPSPCVDARGRLLAVLYAGDLLSRRYEIVDAIKRRVFLRTIYEGHDIGAVTIFQGDLRISTSLTLEDGSRAVGTRLSAAVCDEVLDRGRTWTAPALVINDWYLTASEPIRDPAGRVIGVLSVGLLQAPFVHRQRVIIGVLLAIVVTAAGASLVLIFFVTAAVLRPIGAIVAMSKRRDRRRPGGAGGHPAARGNGRALPGRRRHGRRPGRARGAAQTRHQPAARTQREAGLGRPPGGRRGP